MPLPPSLIKSTIVLASNSPRRRELLGLIVPDYQTAITRDVEETYPADLPAEKVAPYLSRLKAEAYLDTLAPDEILITADTVVISDTNVAAHAHDGHTMESAHGFSGEILGKPADRAEAIEMLSRLSGMTHKVVTGVTLASRAGIDTFDEHTLVTFDHLKPSWIETYVDQFQPLDKAGAYGIQEWLGCIGIKAINGCFYNVMGLPLHTLYQHLLAHDSRM